MKRREFIAGLGGAAAWPLVARAQQPDRTYRIGLLTTGGNLPQVDERRKAILEGLSANGFVEGRNIVLEVRGGDGRYERLVEQAVAFKASKVDVLITFGYPAAAAAKGATKAIPIVVIGSGDPVATGLAESLARPGGNLTGMTELSTELSAKRLEILRGQSQTCVASRCYGMLRIWE
jgi:putative ABC transport system substrate-binding protein